MKKKTCCSISTHSKYLLNIFRCLNKANTLCDSYGARVTVTMTSGKKQVMFIVGMFIFHSLCLHGQCMVSLFMWQRLMSF